ncbi:LytR family transcriptional regulator [Gracilibacillus salitolerans]|uniref:LytR family transcriptional regulator n=1 Tax=Gracilibacillus salitolerans TaxID=2663022 RepID=A0A5Q2TP16_9BACI|nr:LCP family protein [Gracilibacillus salitolerans]QGH35590.1 LytR family transcriptional regulator [Gracilibacillus salitolerans]
MSELRTDRKNRKKSNKWKKRILWIVLLLFISVIGYGIYLFVNVYGATKESHEEIVRPDGKSELREDEVTIGDDPISILLIGVEDYETDGQNGRADTQIVVTINPNTNQMTMTTVPRDTRMEFSAEEAGQYAGFHKMNASYTYGSIFDYGANKLTVEKVEQLLDIPIDEYVTVNFDGFRDIVDALGGVTVDIKEPFWEKNFYVGGEKIYFEEGESILNGEEALAFVRMRKRDVNDIYSRDERQRQFIQASIDEAISAESLFKVGEITDILGENVTTSLSASEIFNLQKAYSSMNSSNIKTFEIEGGDQKIDGTWYFIPSEEGINTTSQQLKQELELELEEGNTSDYSADEDQIFETE